MPALRTLALAAFFAYAQAIFAQAFGAPAFDFGHPASPQDLARYVAIPPSGAGLPPGHGTAQEGRDIYANACQSCHGAHLEGNKEIVAPALVGGRGTLAAGKPVKTVESYWPYATTLFDYIKRAMPFNAPGSLSDDQVYAVSAYILAQAKIWDPTKPLDAKNLPRIEMPNRNGFVPDPRPK